MVELGLSLGRLLNDRFYQILDILGIEKKSNISTNQIYNPVMIGAFHAITAEVLFHSFWKLYCNY